jgi:hypothetical protein
MFIFKSCPKCRGDLAVEQDEYARTLFNRDTDFVCLQCGYRLVPPERKLLLARIRERVAAQRVGASARPLAAA